jgi:hypothetical protein
MKERLPLESAEQFAKHTLVNVVREYPYALGQILHGPDDLKSPRELHPIFFGCFDWHSCVHGYWQLARLHRLMPELSLRHEIEERFDEAFTEENMAGEIHYFEDPKNRGFERPYGWAWLLMLCDELSRQTDERGRQWHAMLIPLADVIVDRFMEYLPKASYPVRSGTHSNSAFAAVLAMHYAHSHGQKALESQLRSKARGWYQNDLNCQAWEPSQDDFLSPALIEALCMSRVLPRAKFKDWLSHFLPDLHNRRPSALFTPAVVSDRTDGKIAHLDGLNLSRAWCFRGIAHALDQSSGQVLTAAADSHLAVSLPHLFGDYAGEHWLATFALLALTDQ